MNNQIVGNVKEVSIDTKKQAHLITEDPEAIKAAYAIVDNFVGQALIYDIGNIRGDTYNNTCTRVSQSLVLLPHQKNEEYFPRGVIIIDYVVGNNYLINKANKL